MPDGLDTAFLPKRIITATHEWALSALYCQGKKRLGLQRVLRTLWESGESAIAVGLILRRYLECEASSVELVVNLSCNDHSAAHFMAKVGGPLSALGVRVSSVYRIDGEKVTAFELRDHHLLEYKNGHVLRTEP